MAMRLHELHPSLVHFPLAFYPFSLATDTIGRLTGSRSLLNCGRMGIALTAGSVALAGLAGLIAQEEVNVEGPAGDMLVTHRNLNIAFLALTTAMTVRRLRRTRPSLRYLLVGFAGLGAALYSAYLGGNMVYEHGVGVKPAGGIARGHAPQLWPSRAGEVARHALGDAKAGVQHAVEAVARGEIIPAITHPAPETSVPGPMEEGGGIAPQTLT
jgi:uncharacterized membrane protein